MTWKGRQVSELSKDELIDALREMAELYNRTLMERHEEHTFTAALMQDVSKRVR